MSRNALFWTRIFRITRGPLAQILSASLRGGGANFNFFLARATGTRANAEMGFSRAQMGFSLVFPYI